MTKKASTSSKETKVTKAVKDMLKAIGRQDMPRVTIAGKKKKK
jgi:3-methyladenine DNA glycosylase AlkD